MTRPPRSILDQVDSVDLRSELTKDWVGQGEEVIALPRREAVEDPSEAKCSIQREADVRRVREH
jgi:hypothetical protein